MIVLRRPERFCRGVEAPGFARDIRRIAREIAMPHRARAFRRRGKGLRTSCHASPQENGIEVDVIAGSSMALFRFRWRGATAGDGKALRAKWKPLGTMKLIDPAFLRAKDLSRRTVIARLRKTLGDAHFSISPVLAHCRHGLEHGGLRCLFQWRSDQSRARHSAIPGVCVPVEIDGETYIECALPNRFR